MAERVARDEVAPIGERERGGEDREAAGDHEPARGPHQARPQYRRGRDHHARREAHPRTAEDTRDERADGERVVRATEARERTEPRGDDQAEARGEDGETDAHRPSGHPAQHAVGGEDDRSSDAPDEDAEPGGGEPRQRGLARR